MVSEIDKEAAYLAGRQGYDYYYILCKYGDHPEISRRFNDGRKERAKSDGDGEGLGYLLLFFMICVKYLIFYSPFIGVALILLYPFTPDRPEKLEDFFTWYVWLYLIPLIIISYLTLCGFEYLRARLIHARLKNRKWRSYFFYAYFFRIVIPAFAAYLSFWSWNDYPSDDIGAVVCGILIAVGTLLLMAWKVKLLGEEDGPDIAAWAYKKGENSMKHIEVLPLHRQESDIYNRILKFYIAWAILTYFTGIVIFAALLMVTRIFPMLLLLSGLMSLVALAIARIPAKNVIDRFTSTFYFYQITEKVDSSRVNKSFWKALLISMPFILTIPMMALEWFNSVWGAIPVSAIFPVVLIITGKKMSKTLKTTASL